MFLVLAIFVIGIANFLWRKSSLNIKNARKYFYQNQGLTRIFNALRPGGALGVWSFSDDPAFTKRLKAQGFQPKRHRVPASRKGRGRYHVVWIAMRPTQRGS